MTDGNLKLEVSGGEATATTTVVVQVPPPPEKFYTHLPPVLR